MRLFDLAAAGSAAEARALYEWFLPLLRLDVVPKFVQLIKLVAAGVRDGVGAACGRRASSSREPSAARRSP